MGPHKLALLLVVAGVVLLPAPVYLGAAAEAVAPTPKTSQVYAAEPMDLTNASDRERLVERHGSRVALSVHQVSERYSAGEYRAPNATDRVLRTAMAEGSATTDDPGAKADLRAVGGEYRFVHDAYDAREQYYRLRVDQNGSAVEATPVAVSRVANATAERAPRYGTLTPAERATVDRVLANSSDANWGFRPRTDAAFADRFPTPVWKDGTLYSVHVVAHVDDFGPGFTGFVVGMYAAALGGLLVLGGGSIYGVARWRNWGG